MGSGDQGERKNLFLEHNVPKFPKFLNSSKSVCLIDRGEAYAFDFGALLGEDISRAEADTGELRLGGGDGEFSGVVFDLGFSRVEGGEDLAFFDGISFTDEDLIDNGHGNDGDKDGLARADAFAHDKVLNVFSLRAGDFDGEGFSAFTNDVGVTELGGIEAARGVGVGGPDDEVSEESKGNKGHHNEEEDEFVLADECFHSGVVGYLGRCAI